MKMQIKKIFLVRRNTHEVKTYDFALNRTNIIIGQGAKGKTTVFGIVDYVFHAGESNVDALIAEAVQWVGVMLETDGGRYLIARELDAETLGKTENYFKKHLPADSEEIDAAEILTAKPVTGNEIKGLLDRLCGLESITSATNSTGATLPFGIRHLLCIVGQAYDVLCDQKHLFAKPSPMTYQQIAKYFPSIIGVNANVLNEIRLRLRKAKSDLERMNEEIKEAENVSAKWQQGLRDQLVEAKNCGLYPAHDEIPESVSACLLKVREILAKADEEGFHTVDAEKLGDLAERVEACKKKVRDLEMSRVRINDRIVELDAIENEMNEFKNESRKRKSGLEIADWMVKNWADFEQAGLFSYPYAAGRLADEVRGEIEKLRKALKSYEDSILSSSNLLNFKTVSKGEKERLQTQLDLLTKRSEDARAELRQLEADNPEVKDCFRAERKAQQLIGQFKKTLELVSALTSTNVSETERDKLSKAVSTLTKNEEVEQLRLQAKMNDSIEAISARSNEVAQQVGLDDSFNFAHVAFDYAKLDFQLELPDKVIYLRQRKSTANHIAYHVGVTVALQELCSKSEESLLPGFVIYDQPSQARSGDEKDGSNLGEKCFVNVMTALVKSTQREGSNWQPILIDSWPRKVLDRFNKDDYHLVVDLDESQGLVPKEWMSSAKAS